MRINHLSALRAAGLSILLTCAACSSGNGGEGATGGSGGTGGSTTDDPVAAGFEGLARASDAIVGRSEALKSLAALAPEILAAFDAPPANAAIQPKQDDRLCIRSMLGGVWTYTGQGFERSTAGNDLTVELPQVDASGAPLAPISIVGRLNVTCVVKVSEGQSTNRPDITMNLVDVVQSPEVEVALFTFRDSVPGETASFDRSLFDTVNLPTRFDLGASVTSGAGGTGGKTSGLNGTLREVGGSVLLELRVSLAGERDATDEPWTFKELLGDIQGLETLDSRLAGVEGNTGREGIQCLRSPANPPFGIGVGVNSDDPDWRATTTLVVAANGSFTSINPGFDDAPIQCEDDGGFCDLTGALDSATLACFGGSDYENPDVASAIEVDCDFTDGLFLPQERPASELGLYKAGYLGALDLIRELNPVWTIGLTAVLPPSPPCP